MVVTLLNVQIPLVGFVTLAPIILLVFHGYVLIQLLFLAQKIGLYRRHALQSSGEQTSIVQGTHTFVFVRYLISPPADGTSLVFGLIWLIMSPLLGCIDPWY